MKSGVRDVLEMTFKMSISARGFPTCNVSLSVLQFAKARLISYSIHTQFHLHFAQQQQGGGEEQKEDDERDEKGSRANEKQQWAKELSLTN